MTEQLLGIIDAQRGFMPLEEGERLDRAGFGELPVEDGHRIIPVLKRLLWGFGQTRAFTTQDWHPRHTAHFSDTPNFVTNWPVHCVADTAGAQLHPALAGMLMPSVPRFYKGQECLVDGKDDLSYSGYYATRSEEFGEQSLPEWLRDRQAQHVYLGGLALDYCVGRTALDLRLKAGLDVTVILDATRGITEGSTAAMLADFTRAGVTTATSNEVLATLKPTA